MDKKHYRDWEIVEEMPEGFKEQPYISSPLAGHIFIYNGKAAWNGRVVKLLRIKKDTK